MKFPRSPFLATTVVALAILAHAKPPQHPVPASDEGFGRVHMDISCAPAVAAEFDRALALLHNFWYARAFERFSQVAKEDPECATGLLGRRDDLQPSVLG